MSDFELEPWEVLPGVQADKILASVGFGPVLWNGEKTTISALAVRHSPLGALAFFHAPGVEANFVVMCGLAICPFSGQINGSKLERVVRKAIKGEEFSFGRAFYFGEQSCLLSPRETVWVAPRSNQQNAVFSVPFDVMLEHSARVFDWLQIEWNKPDSELRFAWEWNRNTVQERHEFLAERVPRWRELFEVMRAVAHVEELPENANWILDHVDTHNHSPELLARLKPWRKLLKTHFLPFEPFPDSAPECLRDYFRFISNHVAVKGQDVSQHERLEARLRLREWLEQNAPDQIERLLPK